MTGLHSPSCTNPAENRTIPRIAVIVPAYGVAHLVGEALESLLVQTLQDWECFVIDDGAPDDVAGAVAPYLADSRIRFLATGNHGVSEARNTAITETRAPLIALLDGDDLFRPTYLEAMTAALEADPAARIATCNARIFGAVPSEYFAVSAKQGKSDGIHGDLSDVLDRTFNVYIGSTFRRADWEAVGGFDASMTHSEDFDFWVRLMTLGGHAVYIDEVLGDYRVRPGSASANSTRMYQGNIRTYEKVLEVLPDCPEFPLLHALIADNQEALAFENAVDRVIEGDTRQGLCDLRRLSKRVKGAHWQAFFLAWRFCPALARPMLAWRKRAHERGSGMRSPMVLRWLRKAA